jgi:hypothetical protein
MTYEPIHLCASCGREYDLIEWRALPSREPQLFDTEPHRMELRSCYCGSTLGLWTDLDGNPVEPVEDAT